MFPGYDTQEMIVMCYFWNLLSAIHNTQLSRNLRGVDYANLRAAWCWLEVRETFELWALPWRPGSRSHTHHHQRLVASWPLPHSDASVKSQLWQHGAGNRRLMWAAAIHSRGNLSKASSLYSQRDVLCHHVYASFPLRQSSALTCQ